MRSDIVTKFDEIRVDDLHGSVHDQVQGDESIFKTRIASGIRIGVAIVTAVRHDPANTEDGPARVYARDTQGRAPDKRALLGCYRGENINRGFYTVNASRDRRWRLVERAEPDAPGLDEYFQHYWSGVQPVRAETTVLAHDRADLDVRMRDYFDYGGVTTRELFARHPGFAVRRARYDASAVRINLETAHVRFDADKIVRFLYRPLDVRWLYWETARGLITEQRANLAPHVIGVADQRFIVTNQTRRRADGARPTFSSAVPGFDSVDPNARALPRYLMTAGGGAGTQLGLGAVDHATTNVNPEWVGAARMAGITGDDAVVGDVIFFALAAVMHSPRWLATQSQDSDDFPDVALPRDGALLTQAAALGHRIVDLHDPDTAVPGVTTGHIARELATIALPRISPGATTLTKGRFGHAGGEWIADEGAIGSIWINTEDRWENVPRGVDVYTCGGHMLLHKYLCYRVGCGLTSADIRIVTEYCRRIAKLLELQDEADVLAEGAESDPLVALTSRSPVMP
jgi:hypothetical protein